MASPAVINELHDKLLSEFQDKVNDYGVAMPRIDGNFQCISNWIRTPQNESKAQTVSDVVKTSISFVDALKTGDPTRVITGCLKIASSVLSIVAGPYGAAASAIFNILSAIISKSFGPNKPDMATRLLQDIKAEIKNEFQELNHRLDNKKLSGLDLRVKNMVERLELLNKVKKDEPIPDAVLYDTDFLQFIGEVEENFKTDHNLYNEESYKKCVKSLVLWCNANTAYIFLLVNVIAAFESSGRETIFVEHQLKCAEKYLADTLVFLSDEEEMRKKNGQGRHQTLLAIFVLRNNFACKVIKEIRESLGMTKMPSLKKIEAIAVKACHCVPEDVTYQYGRPHERGDYHYFQLINHTDFPIKVRCGKGIGRDVNKLEFVQDVEFQSSYEHAATKPFNSTFSTGGVFVVYLENQTRSDENMLVNDGTDMKVFEFALSMSFWGTKKSAIKDKSNNVPSLANAGQDCWNEMRTGGRESPPVYFEVKGKPHIAFSRYSSEGRNGRKTCRFVVQSYDLQKMRLTDYQQPDKVDLKFFQKTNPVHRSSSEQEGTGPFSNLVIEPFVSDIAHFKIHTPHSSDPEP